MTTSDICDAVREYLNECSTDYESFKMPEYLFDDWATPKYTWQPQCGCLNLRYPKSKSRTRSI